MCICMHACMAMYVYIIMYVYECMCVGLRVYRTIRATVVSDVQDGLLPLVGHRRVECGARG